MNTAPDRGGSPLHFVLDHNFPWQVTDLEWPPSIRITPLSLLDPELVKGHDDWQVLRELARRGEVDGFVTNDADMLSLPTEMVVLSKSRLVLVVTDGVGSDPFRATALVMLHLEEVAKRRSGRPEIYVLRAQKLEPVRPGQQINKIADHRKVPRNILVSEELRRIGSS